MEDLFLTFAKKASAFNSWFENAEEDLTDPVRCNSLEEIKALREAHDAFRSSLSSAQADFNQLAELDRQIKSFRVASNPYTWFTMEALEETWRNLQKIIKVPSHCSLHPVQAVGLGPRSEKPLEQESDEIRAEEAGFCLSEVTMSPQQPTLTCHQSVPWHSLPEFWQGFEQLEKLLSALSSCVSPRLPPVSLG